MLASNFRIVQTSIHSPTKVSNYLNLSDITLHLAVCLFDRTLANTELDEKQLQLTAITCLLLASKVIMMLMSMEMTTLSIMRMVMNEPRSMFASKDLCFFQVEEDFVPAPSLLLPLLGGSQEEKELTDSAMKMKMKMGEMARTERMILKALNFHLRTSTAATFLHYFTQVRTFVY